MKIIKGNDEAKLRQLFANSQIRQLIGEQPDIRLDLPALGSLYMGGFPASLLAAGGRVEELRREGLSAADRLLTTRPSPRSGTGF